MATAADASARGSDTDRDWYSVDPEEVTARLHVDPAAGLATETAAQLLAQNGPNALPTELVEG